MLIRNSALVTLILFGTLSVSSLQANDFSSALYGYSCAESQGENTPVCRDSYTRLTQKEILKRDLRSLIFTASNGEQDAFLLPDSWNYQAIPQDPANPITREKVKLGRKLFHETALATEGVNPERAGTWSCASCHHAAAGFKSGIRQGIGEGGDGFGPDGSWRMMAYGFGDHETWLPDVQPFASPSILNTAYQDVMLWNGQLGNATNGIVNSGLPRHILAPAGTPKVENRRNLSGLETQAIAGFGVHRQGVEREDSVLKTVKKYRNHYRKAFPNGGDTLQNAGLAVAAYERTVLANRSKFQKFLRGQDDIMSKKMLRGGIVFFGKGRCTECHRGPALSSDYGATEDEMFFAIGFADFDPNAWDISGPVTENDKRGRGGFTQQAEDNYKFKIPQLYNLADTDVFGHGASFSSIKDVVDYKNKAVPQVVHGNGSYLDRRFVPLGLTDQEVQDLVVFLEKGLYDKQLGRYTPNSVPSGNCFPVADKLSNEQLNCY